MAALNLDETLTVTWTAPDGPKRKDARREFVERSFAPLLNRLADREPQGAWDIAVVDSAGEDVTATIPAFNPPADPVRLFPASSNAPGVALLRCYADQVRGGKPVDDAAGEMCVDLGGQLTRSEVEALLLTEVADVGPGDGWHLHPTVSTMDKLLAARV